MPKSKRQKLVSLTKVSKKTKEHKGAQITELQKHVEKWKYCWLFEVGNMRNAHLQTVRNLWKDTLDSSARIFFGRGAVMAKALGKTPEEEHRPGLAKLSVQIKGQVGLLFTDTEPTEVIEWFKDFRQLEFARQGNRAARTVIIPAGPIMQHHSDPPEPFPHNEEPQLRKLGLTTVMKKGVPSLHVPHKLCEKGKPLTSEQAQLLKLIGEKMVEFRVGLKARWDAATGEVVQIDDPAFSLDDVEQQAEADEDGNDAMTIETSAKAMTATREFKLKTGDDVFTPKNLIELARPSAGVANLPGDLVLVPVSKYSFETKNNQKSIFIAPLESTVAPIEVPLADGGETFWLNPYIVGHVVANEGEKTSSLYAINVRFTTESMESLTHELPVLVGTFPTSTASNFRYQQQKGVLVFADSVYDDGNVTAVNEHDKAWENRGNTAYVYDETYERHWDTWSGPKKSSLFSVKVFMDPGRTWHFGDQFVNVLKGTGHHSPVEPFGGTDDFDISGDHIIYTTKDPELPEAWHTKQNVYIVDFWGNEKPRELTSGKQGAIHNPVFNWKGDKAAWLELDKDGYESDRAKIVIYDLKKDVRFTLTQPWDRSPDSLAFSIGSEFLYLTAGDDARNKLYVLPIPPTPESSSTHPDLSSFYTTPVELTHDGAVTGLQTLFYGRLMFTRSSVTGPGDVFILHKLRDLEDELSKRKDARNADEPLEWKAELVQVTRFTEEALKGKDLAQGESFYFEGAEGKKVQGWIYKPKGFKTGEEKKWPVLLLIHGGPQGVWDDRWSTRWNPNVFAQQGYFTIAINPTGSTTFGQELTDAIAKDWGGKPFVDLQKGWAYVLGKYPEIDSNRAAAAGASWGGYAIKYGLLHGHPEFSFNFKALVCHDGVFDAAYNGYSTDELFFFNHEWGGRPWDPKAKKILEKFNPTNFVHKWSTPQLVIHGSKDYRLPETDGIGAFHALRQLGVPSRLVIFPNENHWVLNHGNSLKWHYEVFRWLDLYTGKHDGDENVEIVKLQN
ncbi:hypothetical protein EW146_g6161 [Bondarzewia mesenterica]|uniref:Dipeptidyl-peptidase V n=1 Tax=Bondarzewia mesenterica TaxID=1095465 RepID=A0A4S4LV47_9AGAM|nr:hypothetical protein EW146_g6161 [Bondarzewia mesenterica]